MKPAHFQKQCDLTEIELVRGLPALTIEPPGLFVQSHGPFPVALFRQIDCQAAQKNGVLRFMFGCEDGVAGGFVAALQLEGQRHDLAQQRPLFRLQPPGPLKMPECCGFVAASQPQAAFQIVHGRGDAVVLRFGPLVGGDDSQQVGHWRGRRRVALNLLGHQGRNQKRRQKQGDYR
jgi:hypothetical protein